MDPSQTLDPVPLPPPARLGEVLDKYRLERIVATGGMGVVVEATHLHLHQRVAIKFMSPLLAGDPSVVERFLQEARAAARLRSEHVARVFDVDTLPAGTPYIVMEFLEGEDMGAMLARRGWFPPSEAVECVLQACEAIAEAHLLGIVHRDLKPENLFHCERPDRLPFLKVLDFGVSKLLPKGQVALQGRTATGPFTVMGTPQYASPEQLQCSAAVDERADIWALGVILYELIAGKPPFRATTLFELKAKVVGGPPQPLHELRPEVSPELSAVVIRCLAKEADNRYATVADLAESLAPHAPPNSVISVERVQNILQSVRPAPSTGGGGAPVPPSIVPVERTKPSVRPQRVALVALAGAIVGGALIAAGWVAAASPSETRPVLWTAEAPAATASARSAPASTLYSAEARSERVEASSPGPEAQEQVPVPTAASATAAATAATATRPSHSRSARGTESFGGLL